MTTTTDTQRYRANLGAMSLAFSVDSGGDVSVHHADLQGQPNVLTRSQVAEAISVLTRLLYLL